MTRLLSMCYSYSVVVVLVLCHASCEKSVCAQGVQSRRTCVVGAGVAGLVTAQQLLSAGQQVSVLEATAHVGGTWYYEPKVGTDEYGRPIHSSMYKYLRTNVPRQLMELPEYPMPPETPTFPNGTTYYQYIQNYTDHFNLRQHIKLLHEVMLVSREGDLWRVVYRNLESGMYYIQHFDYVIVCVGHYSKPQYPEIPGVYLFRGSIIHSHDYREPEPYSNRSVLIVGSGPSALDLVTTLTRYSRRVVHSHHSTQIQTPFPGNYVRKPDCVQYTEDGMLFRDGTYEKIDDVIYGTGYQFNFPFLDHSCGLISQPRFLVPLHNHIVNVHYPTMLFVGLVFRACSIITLVTQAKYAAAIASGRGTLPPQHVMFQEWQRRAGEIAAHGGKPSDIHAVPIGLENLLYYNNITAEARLPPVPPVLPAICKRDGQAKLENFFTFRDYVYNVLDDEHFTRGCHSEFNCESDERFHNETSTFVPVVINV